MATAQGIHPIPSRTRKLSLAARMVLLGRPGGRVRRCQPDMRTPWRGRRIPRQGVHAFRTCAAALSLGPSTDPCGYPGASVPARRRSLTARSGFLAPITALTTAHPAAPAAKTCGEFRTVTPPIPNTGTSTLRATSPRRPRTDRRSRVRLRARREDGPAPDVVGARGHRCPRRAGIVRRVDRSGSRAGRSGARRRPGGPPGRGGRRRRRRQKQGRAGRSRRRALPRCECRLAGASRAAAGRAEAVPCPGVGPLALPHAEPRRPHPPPPAARPAPSR